MSYQKWNWKHKNWSNFTYNKEGGLSADNYTKIAKTSASTSTRDLKDLVEKQILLKTGTLKSTRYSLNIAKV